MPSDKTLAPSDLSALSRLLDEALAVAPDEREAWLSGLPAEQAHLSELLRELIVQQDQQTSGGALATMPRLAPTADALGQPGQMIGPYRLIREIGRGGMGSVWLAERADGRFKRELALKLPRLAWGAGLAERMAREREISALLEHPAIARLYDAGLDEHGRPYLAFEYIEGQPIDAWCEAQALTVPVRLRLFVQVARAVAYAHGRLVVHRDLKPSNVLVSPDGQAHLLDFGIAKLLHEAEPGVATLTQQQGRALTPSYASPEQIAGEPVTVASDVYSLGVLLYELLTGTLPLRPKRGTLGAMEEAILEGDAPLASGRVKDRATARALRGEVDAILAKAMQRESARRYATADALAEDIERHLKGEVVSARPDSALYRLRKTIRRHWIAVSATAAVLVAVLSGAGVAVVQAQRAARAAERERVVKEFVADVFRVNVKAPTAPGELRSAPAEAFLEHSGKLVQAKFAGQPALQAELYAVVGKVFSDMGANRLAAEYAVRQVEALNTARAEPVELARAFIQTATALLDSGRLEDAELRARRAVELAATDAALQLDGKVLLARVLLQRDKVEAAKTLLDEVEPRVARLGSPAGLAAIWVMALRARLLVAANQFDAAQPLFDAAIDKALAAEGMDSLIAVSLRLSVARRLSVTDSPDQARRYFDLAAASLMRLGNEHQILAALETAKFAGFRFLAVGQIPAQDALTSIAVARAQLASSGRPLPAEVAAELDFLEGDVLSTWGNVQAGLPLMERSAPVLLAGAQSVADRFKVAWGLGPALTISGRHELADQWLRDSLRLRIQAGRGTHPWAALSYGGIADNLAMAGRHREALALLDTAPTFLPISGEGAGNSNRYGLWIKVMRAKIEQLQGDVGSALRELPRELIADGSDLSISERLFTVETAAVLGEALCVAGRATEGLRYLSRSLELRSPTTTYPHHPDWARTQGVAGLCALQKGDRRSALEWARQARESFTVQPEVSPYYKAPLEKLERALGLKVAARSAG